MIEKQYGKYILICDYCGEEIEFDTFDEALKYMKTLGWKTTKLDGEWANMCDDCREAQKKTNR